VNDPVLIIAGENSGEKYGAELIHEFLKRHPETNFFGIGGAQMQARGADCLFSIDDLSMVGIFEVIAHLKKIRHIFRVIQTESKIRKPKAAVLIDSPDFNLRLAAKLKKQGVPVLYYISPTVWAWRKGRLKTIKKSIRRMLLIFPFEQKIYEDHNIPAVFIFGRACPPHPLQPGFFQKIRPGPWKASYHTSTGQPEE
jgi:lipid-A-disaccharide synthase